MSRALACRHVGDNLALDKTIFVALGGRGLDGDGVILKARKHRGKLSRGLGDAVAVLHAACAEPMEPAVMTMQGMAKITVPTMMCRRTLRDSSSTSAFSSAVTMPSPLRSRLSGTRKRSSTASAASAIKTTLMPNS